MVGAEAFWASIKGLRVRLVTATRAILAIRTTHEGRRIGSIPVVSHFHFCDFFFVLILYKNYYGRKNGGCLSTSRLIDNGNLLNANRHSLHIFITHLFKNVTAYYFVCLGSIRRNMSHVHHAL